MNIHTSQDYEAQLRACTRCAHLMADKPADPTTSSACVVPRPIVLPLRPMPVMLIGQAPGLTEYTTGRPFSGDAGKSIRALFNECGCSASDFELLVHTSAISKCFPGSKLVTKGERTRREDLKPSTAMLSNCSGFMLAQLKIVDPKLVVLLGAMPLKAYVQLKTGKASSAALEDYVGRVDEWNGRRAIALAHTSGLSTWLNDAGHKALQESAKHQLAVELAAISR